MSNFGALTDHFGILALAKTGGGTLADVLKLVDSSKEPVEKSRADARDDNGDIAASNYYGNAAGTLYEASCSYALKSGTLLLSDIALGEVSVGTLALTLEAGTSNSEFPQIKVGGKLGTSAITAPTGKANTFALPAITLTGGKFAQVIGFTVQNGKLTSSSISATVEEAQQDDGVGEPAAFGISGGVGAITAEFVRYDATAPAWTVTLSGATETKAPGIQEGQAAHHTATATAAFTITRNAA